RERARPDAEHGAAEREVIEHDHAVSEDERVMVGQRGNARPEAYVPSPLGGSGDESLRRGDKFVAGGVVLTHPGLIERQMVEELDELKVAPQGVRRVLPDTMERG